MYTNATLIAAYLQRELTDDEVAWLNVVIPTIQLWIDRKLNSHFGEVDAETRYFSSDGESIDVTPVQSITAFSALYDDNTVAYAYTATTEYLTEPVNSVVKNEIRGRSTNTFSKKLQRYAVTGKFTEFDYENNKVPDDIQAVATRIAGGLLVAGKATGAGGVIQSESLEGHSVSYDNTQDNIETIADSDPVLQGILGARREVFV